MWSILALSLGIGSWSLLEYIIHRYWGHGRAPERNPFGREHRRHHSEGNYFAAAVKKAFAACIVTSIVAPLACLLGGLQLGLLYTAGLVAFYLYYELFHRLLHTHRALTPYGRWARRHHFFHHFHNPRRNYGVTSPIWDTVFRTATVPARPIVVPRKLAMPWLVRNEARKQEQDDYVLRRA